MGCPGSGQGVGWKYLAPASLVSSDFDPSTGNLTDEDIGPFSGILVHHSLSPQNLIDRILATSDENRTGGLFALIS